MCAMCLMVHPTAELSSETLGLLLARGQLRFFACIMIQHWLFQFMNVLIGNTKQDSPWGSWWVMRHMRRLNCTFLTIRGALGGP